MRSFAVILFFGSLLAACSQRHDNNTTKNEPKPDTLKVLSLKKGKVEKQTSLPGELFAFEHVEIHPKVTGYIKQLKVDIGTVVKRGQILAVIDAPEIQSRLGEANGKFQASKAKFQASLDNYNRIKDAAKTEGVIAPSELERAKNQMLTDSADYNAARYSAASFQQVGNYLAVAAPFNGTITQRNVNEGSYVAPNGGKPILVIEDNSKLRLRIAVPEALTGVSLKDNKVKFSTKSNPNQLFDAVLMRKAGTIDADTRTEIWEFEIQNEKGALKPGSFTNVVMNIFRSENSYLVPFSSVVTTLERKFVIKVSNDSTHWIDVSQGLNLSDKTEIFGNLKEGDTLVIKGNEEIRAKQKVAVKFAGK
ncbi:MAG: efflux RND transporter periplasmic adaptor subunit [Cyclobacteriaceae bacterium]|nr:efflux RND transporter periplasmic adaptor subunit [Cyclobacteriaceae bacterium]